MIDIIFKIGGTLITSGLILWGVNTIIILWEI